MIDSYQNSPYNLLLKARKEDESEKNKIENDHSSEIKKPLLNNMNEANNFKHSTFFH